jgi:hypothetical protein
MLARHTKMTTHFQGTRVEIASFVANHYTHSLDLGVFIMRVIHVLNNTPISYICNRHKTGYQRLTQN